MICQVYTFCQVVDMVKNFYDNIYIQDKRALDKKVSISKTVKYRKYIF